MPRRARAFREIDTNDDDKIDFGEFTAWWAE